VKQQSSTRLVLVCGLPVVEGAGDFLGISSDHADDLVVVLVNGVYVPDL
jgi:hypothetical protein